MTKEFVPYQESLELKEIDFNEPCLGLYKEDGSFLYADVFSFREPYSPSEFKEGVDEGVYYINSEILEELITAPTFSQAFRWFRKTYKLHSKIEIQDVELDWYFYEILEVKNGQYNNDLHQEMNFKSYEEAEIACLKKLIEIVKNGKTD